MNPITCAASWFLKLRFLSRIKIGFKVNVSVSAELQIKESISKEHTHEGSSTIKLHGDAESINYYYPLKTLNFTVEISNKYFTTIKQAMSLLYITVHIK